MIYKLLFVIILASNVFAQHTTPNLIERDSTGKLTAAPVNVDTTIYWTTITSLPYSYAIAEFLELYKEYETECWNDSMFVDIIKENSGMVPTQFVRYCISKKPTFSGFIEYLRKKQ